MVNLLKLFHTELIHGSFIPNSAVGLTQRLQKDD